MGQYRYQVSIPLIPNCELMVSTFTSTIGVFQSHVKLEDENPREPYLGVLMLAYMLAEFSLELSP